MIKTYKYRLKSKNLSYLDKAASSVNFVWNYCNEVSMEYLDKHYKWLSGYDLSKLTTGCSKQLDIDARSIQIVCQEYARRRYQSKKRKLSWRSKKRSLGWIPFYKDTIKIMHDTIVHHGKVFMFWKSRDVDGEVKSGSFTQDSQGRWYVSICCEVNPTSRIKTGKEVGIDLGLKTIATLSNGISLNRENITAKFSLRLAVAQRAKKKKLVAKINTKIKNYRRNWNHTQTTNLVRDYDKIIIGNVSPSKIKLKNLTKSIADASWADFKSMLAYKAKLLGIEYKEVKENFSTVTCSTCFERTGPRGLGALGVREWMCMHCGTIHNRDVNAAKNILRFMCESPIKGSHLYVEAQNKAI